MNMQNINLIEYLDDRGINYRTSGKNISSGWIGINCPFCNDSSNHLGINLQSKAWSCFRCGEKGNLLKLIHTIDNVSWTEAKKIVNQYGAKIYAIEEEPKHNKVFKITEKFDPLTESHKHYLEKRNFDPEYLEKKYKLCSGRLTSDYNHRIIIPFFYHNRMVTFTSRDVTGKSNIKYIGCPINKSIIPIKETLYNIDNVKKSCIVCEGCMDVFRIGDGSVALNGVNATMKQIHLLSEMKRVFILFDPEEKAQKQAEKLAGQLSSCVDHVEVVNLDSDCDPGDLSEQDALYLKKELIGRG